MKEGDKVQIVTFQGGKKSKTKIKDVENYWRLIGYKGVIVKDPNEKSIYASFSKKKKVLVLFDKNVKELNLECHNTIDNALWFLESDVLVLK